MKLLMIITATSIIVSIASCNGQNKKTQMEAIKHKETPVQLKAFTPNLMVKDVNQTVRYYTDILGFQLVQSYPNTGIYNWAMVKKENATIMFQSSVSLKDEFKELENYDRGGALTFFIQVADTKLWYELIKDKVQIIKPYGITSYNGANEFVIMDPNGFILHFSDITFE